MNLMNEKLQKKHVSTCGITDFEIFDGFVATLSIDQRILFFKDFELVKSKITQIADGSALVKFDDKLIVVGDGIEEIIV